MILLVQHLKFKYVDNSLIYKFMLGLLVQSKSFNFGQKMSDIQLLFRAL